MGMPGTWSRHITPPGLAAFAAAGVAILAAACGSQAATTSSATQPASTAPASTGPASTGPASSGGKTSPASRLSPAGGGTAALCSSPAAVTRLVVSRVSALPQNHTHFAFPAGVTVSSPARARAVAEAVCGLPAMPSGAMSCPADWGLSYRLSVAAGTRTFPVVTAAASGCGGVTGAGQMRWTARSPGFWTVLARAMGIASGTALRGTSAMK